MRGLSAEAPSLIDYTYHSLLVYFQAGYEKFSELKEAIIREVEEAIARGELVRSARRFVEELANSRVPYARRVEYLMGQVRLAQGMDDHNWLHQNYGIPYRRIFV